MKRFAAAALVLLLLCPAAQAAGPPAPITRGGFVEALWTVWGEVPYEDTRVFSDVGHDETYTTAVCWAHSLGLVNGTGGGLFAPERPITREEAAVLLRRAAEHLGRDTATLTDLAECNDYDGISFWADDSLYWATDTGLMDFSPGGLLDPQGTLTLADLTMIFYRFAY